MPISYPLFCTLGCDRKHEDEIDPDEISKSFVLRVMAARSPNVRKRANATKCPLSAPPKPSRPRVSKLAVLSSISRKLMDGKEKVAAPVHPVKATPNVEVKKLAMASNAMTTPGNKKSVLKPDLFCSVRNTKEATNSKQSTKAIAKALTFHSPTKVVKKQTSLELAESIKHISVGMKRLDISGQRKNILGHEKITLPRGASNKKMGTREVKSRVYDSLRSQSHKDKENIPSTCLKKKGFSTELKRIAEPKSHDVSSGDSSDMEVDSNHGSLEESSVEVTASELFEVPVVQAGSDELTKELTLHVEKLVPSLEETIQNETTCIEGVLAANDKEGSLKVSEKTSIKIVQEGAHSRGVLDANDQQGSHEISILNYNRERHQASENDEKENASHQENNRVNPEGKIIGKQGIKGKILKATQKDKSLKEKAADPRSIEGGKYTKLRATNPKPFRLRTDERGVLKETNLEKKLLRPLEESSSTPGLTAGNLQARKHQNLLKRNENVPEQCEDNKQSGAKIDTAQQPKFRSKQQRTTVITSLRQSRESIKRAKLLLLKQPQRSASNRKPVVPSMTQKDPEENSHKQKMESTKNETHLGIIKTASPGIPRSLSRGRRPPTVPKEPNFHKVHVPKSCAQKSTQAACDPLNTKS
ncbi:hypothetical protein SAY86_017486 [Trapa natans]|uniref:Uncharacterized protein n=1 Tax=Trapa natans TaxID=22666 RepID=A0AAN7LQH0_TRANT|nr:hypothetical protein SAY86_017486 [Trapa natans]